MAASHVLMIEPVRFRYHAETGATNVFQLQAPLDPEEEEALGRLALAQHRALRDLLIGHGVLVTACRALETTPDGPFCNNWFSTHAASGTAPAMLVLYPLLARARRPERRPDLVAMLQHHYPRTLDLSPAEEAGQYLESTGSLCIHHPARTAYACLSARTDPGLAAGWARETGHRLVTFRATDAGGTPYYHTNVMMFIGHGVAGVTLEAIEDAGERSRVASALEDAGLEVLPLSRAQAARFCGNAIALASESGEPLLVLSSAAWAGFDPAQRDTLSGHARVLHTDLSAFERVGGGSARCLVAELF